MDWNVPGWKTEGMSFVSDVGYALWWDFGKIIITQFSEKEYKQEHGLRRPDSASQSTSFSLSLLICKMGILMPTLTAFSGYHEHHNKYFILLSLYIHKVYLPCWLVNFPGTGTMVWCLNICSLVKKKLASIKCLGWIEVLINWEKIYKSMIETLNIVIKSAKYTLVQVATGSKMCWLTRNIKVA